MTVTRGHGLLESFLAQRRSAQARKLLQSTGADGPILDIGCGSVPTFLLDVPFEQRIGLERFSPSVPENRDIQLVLADATEAGYLPFVADAFGVVTMLAVLEHLPETRVLHLTNEISRILRPAGILIMTTPARGTGALLSLLAKVGVVSPVEIEEHQRLYTKSDLRGLLHESHFDNEAMRLGSFELLMNNWVLARKGSS